MEPTNEPKSELSWITTKHDLATVRYRGLLLHSLYDPVGEAEKMVVSLVKDNPSLVVVFGLGLGYHLNALRQKLEDLEILVFEPYEEIYQAAVNYPHTDWQDDPNIQVYNDLETLEDVLIHRCIYNDQARFPFLWVYPPYRKLAPLEVARLETCLQNLKVRQASNTRTLREKTQLWLQNIEANWQWLMKLPNISDLHRVFEKIPCVVVASGPSLSRNYSILNQIQVRALLFVASSVYPWLLNKNIVPSMMAILEGGDESAQFTANGIDDRTWMALASSTHPNHFSEVQDRTLVFHSERWLAKLIDQEPFVPHGGNVASAAFTMALIMGCNPIILVGQDLSYEEDTLHAKGQRYIGEEEVLKYRNFPMQGKSGVVYGHSAMVSYLSWYEESARYLARVRPDLDLINATEGGARIRGFQEMTLEEACKKYCGRAVDIHGPLQEWLSDAEIDTAAVKQRLLRMQRDLLEMENNDLNSQMLRDSLAWEFCTWLLGGQVNDCRDSRTEASPEIIREAKEFVCRLIEKI